MKKIFNKNKTSQYLKYNQKGKKDGIKIAVINHLVARYISIRFRIDLVKAEIGVRIKIARLGEDRKKIAAQIERKGHLVLEVLQKVVIHLEEMLVGLQSLQGHRVESCLENRSK